MHRFWTRFIEPVIEAAAPRRMIEVGAEFGWNTEKLLHYCRRAGCVLDVVDPMPHPVLHDVLRRFPDEHRYHPLRSLDAIPLLPCADLVLLDGDHNWTTVYHELQALFTQAAAQGLHPPIVLLHDMAWPYARRDMYYDPKSIDEADCHPHAQRGILPGQSELTDHGINGQFRNALHEGGPRNGVLTGVEDFAASWPAKMTLHRLPFFNGLGIIVPEVRETPALDRVIAGFFSRDSLLQTCETLESDGMKVRAELAAYRMKLTQRNDMLVRAQSRIVALEQALAEAGLLESV